MSRINLYCEDMLTGIPKRVAAGSVDVVVTSPPYNLGTRYGTYDDREPRDAYLQWTNRWMEVIYEALSDHGSLFLNLGSKPTDPWGPFQVAIIAFNRFKLQNTIHWIKAIATDGLVVGHYKPINSPRFLNDHHEYVFHFTKTGTVPIDRLAVGVAFRDKSNLKRGTRGRYGDRHCRGNTWFIPYETIRCRETDRPHPAAFPVELPQRCYQLHGLDRIRCAMDPFLGIGTSAVAAKELGIPFIGFEIDPDYHAQALRNVAKEVTHAV